LEWYQVGIPRYLPPSCQSPPSAHCWRKSPFKAIGSTVPGNTPIGAGRRLQTAELRTPYTVHLSPLPCWEHLTAPEYQRRIAEIVADIESQAALRRQIDDRPAKGPESVLAQEPHGAPETLKKSPAPLFHPASRKVRQELYEAYKYFVAAFKDAAARLRAGEMEVLFPPGCFPPASPWVSG
jgi:hypothetical protein